MSPDKLSAGSGSVWMGGAEEPPKIEQRRAVHERPSRKESVFGKMLTNETMSLCAQYLRYNKVLVTKCTSAL